MAVSIQEMYENFKHILKDDGFFYSVLIVLVAITSFGLGQWSAKDSVKQGSFAQELPAFSLASSTKGSVKVVPVTPKSEVKGAEIGEKAYVASKSGTKFHLLTCPGAKQIKEENKIFFSSKEEAQSAGYSPAGNCKGI